MKLADAVREAGCAVLPERAAGHPRVFLREDEVDALKERAQGALRGDWLAVMAETVSRPQLEPAALCYVISGDDFYLGLAREHIRRLMEDRAWAGEPYDPQQNNDLRMGRSLVSLSFAYDLLFHHLAPAEREEVREQLARNCFQVPPGVSYFCGL